ncbi:MAG: YggS family pyridoxal phosphate-dependent enzyme [Clostridium sp.]|nr:YggS family pyridoxal phosphate-dependent enzyme [Clostridium sp.]
MVSENLNEVQNRMNSAAERAGRNPEDVLLIAVSKTKPVELMMEAYNAGIRDFGENKVQEILRKAPEMPDDVRWHMIGHLQKNKVRQVIGKAVMIHSVDSVELAEKIEKEAEKQDLQVDILLEVNVAGEETKFGFAPEEVEDAARAISAFPRVHIRGLMTSAPDTERPEDNRKFFRKLSDLSVDMKSKNFDNIYMSALSMGMTNDFEVAVEEGATMIRVGTAVFGARTN